MGSKRPLIIIVLVIVGLFIVLNRQLVVWKDQRQMQGGTTIERRLEERRERKYKEKLAQFVGEDIPDSEMIASDTGLKYKDILVGEGAEVKQGDTVVIHFTVWTEDRENVQSTYLMTEPLDFALGDGTVIQGFEEGLLGMRVGGKRRLVIPPELGYGEQGLGDIGPDTILHYDLEVVEIKPDKD